MDFAASSPDWLVSGPLHVVAANVVEGRRRPGFAPIDAYPMQLGCTPQQHGCIGFLIRIGLWGLTASWRGGQGRYAQEFHSFAVPLLADLMPMLSLVV